ncbi:MAG: succinylglutamate desuccinylase/aspartoacylase family protein [Alphaproteobacteria bacterium]
MSDTTNPIACTVDLTAPGRNLGYLLVPHSVHRSAYGHIHVPVASLVGPRDGPSILLMAGNHGDEYEGQIILSGLMRDLDPDRISGRLTLLPMANFPAAEAGMRTSPADGGNLNRSFPGKPRGTPTEMLAHFIEHRLVAGTDLVIDLHSGGSSLYCVPFGMTSWVEGNEHNPLRRSVMAALGLDAALYHLPDGDGWYSSSAAWRAGAAGFTLELGGGGTVDPEIRRRARDGVLRALRVAGGYDDDGEAGPIPDHPREFKDESLIFAEEPGLYEPLCHAGDSVDAGKKAACIHFPETPGKAPLDVIAPRDGYILAHRVPARVLRGDCLFHVGH